MLGEGRIIGQAANNAALGSWGELVSPTIAESRIETIYGDTFDLDERTATWIRRSTLWLDDVSGLLLVIEDQGCRITAFDLPAAESWEVARLERFDERGFRWIRLRPSPAGDLLVLYERGLVCIGPGGRARWHSRHDAMSAGFGSVDADSVTICPQHDELDWVMTYSLADGSLIA